MWEDPIVAEVRREREEFARQFDFDLHTMFEDLRQRQSQLGSRLVRRGPRAGAEQAPEPESDSGALHPGR
ncbi:MAG: hypothetical protein AB1646_05180 [Thermodesulfobacteriota bacterium]